MPLITIGQAIDKSWEHYRNNLRELLSVSAWLLIIPILDIIGIAIFPSIGVVFGNLEPTAGDIFGILFYTVLTLIVTPVVSVWIFIALTRVIRQQLEKKRVNVKKTLKDAWKLFFPVVWVGILVSLMFLAAIVIGMGPGILAYMLSAQFPSTLTRLVSGLIGASGMIVALVLIARWTVSYAMAQYALILDGKRGTAALTASRKLIQGRWWSTLILLIVPVFVFVLLAYLATFILGFGSEILINAAAGLNADVYGKLDAISTSVFPSLVLVAFQPLLMIPVILVYRSLKRTYKAA